MKGWVSSYFKYLIYPGVSRPREIHACEDWVIFFFKYKYKENLSLKSLQKESLASRTFHYHLKGLPGMILFAKFLAFVNMFSTLLSTSRLTILVATIRVRARSMLAISSIPFLGWKFSTHDVLKHICSMQILSCCFLFTQSLLHLSS